MSTHLPAGTGTRLPVGLYGICDDGFATALTLEEQAAGLMAGGVKVLQVRVKRTPVRRALASLRHIVGFAKARGVVTLVNDRVDWALLCGAEGVHLGAEDLPVEEARALLGPQALIGATVRDVPGAHAAEALGASYVGLGPVFATSTKEVGVAPVGLDGVREVVGCSRLPVVGIAGVGLGNIASLAAAGVHGAAVLSELLGAQDLEERARKLQAAFDEGRRAGLRLRS